VGTEEVVLKDAITFTTKMYEIPETENNIFQIPVLDFRGTPTGIDVAKIVETGILPAINTGIAHKKPGIGMVGAGLDEIFAEEKYQLMNIEMFNKGIIHAECMGGDIDLLLNRRVQVGCSSWKLVDGEASIARNVVFVEDDEYDALMEKKAKCELTKFGDIDGGKNAWLYEEAKKK